MTGCVADTVRSLLCRDGQAAVHLKLVSVVVIFLTSLVGMCSPLLLASYFHGKSMYDKAIVLIKCFAAGVILSTSLVHVLPDAYEALGDCQVSSNHPWKDFPFAGLVTLVGAVLALFVDLAASSHVEDTQSNSNSQYVILDTRDVERNRVLTRKGEAGESELELTGSRTPGCHANEIERVEEMAKLKQRLVSQILEIGIIFHSVIIGVTLGMSQNVCTIKPLVAALAFHQIFEGMGLGGCVAQAGFSLGTSAYMCFMFSVTTPMGIVLGMILFYITGYDDSNPNALILEGLLGSVSSGILIYMALVDLIAVDFFHNKLITTNLRLKQASFMALILGSAAMSVLALWA